MPPPALDDRDNRTGAADERSASGFQTTVQSDHGCASAEGMADDAGERPELSADVKEHFGILQDVGLRPGRIAVSGRIDGHGPEARLDEGR